LEPALNGDCSSVLRELLELPDHLRAKVYEGVLAVVAESLAGRTNVFHKITVGPVLIFQFLKWHLLLAAWYILMESTFEGGGGRGEVPESLIEPLQVLARHSHHLLDLHEEEDDFQELVQ